MRVLTWNLQGRIGAWEKRQLAIESVLASVAPDLVMLQESWVEPNGRTQASLLAEGLDFHSASAIELAGFDTYPQANYWVVNAIISRWPLQIRRAVSLVDENGAPTWRHVLAVTVDRPTELGGPFLAAGTHLEHGIDRSETRSAQMNHLVNEIADLLGDSDTRKRSLPAVVAGDFNAVPWSDEVRRATGASAPYLLLRFGRCMGGVRKYNPRRYLVNRKPTCAPQGRVPESSTRLHHNNCATTPQPRIV